MLSEKHNNNAIAFCLGQWLRTEIPLPEVVVTDMSKALIMASVHVFKQYSNLKKYLKVCSSLLKAGKGEIPTGFIRCNFNHLMHIMSTYRHCFV